MELTTLQKANDLNNKIKEFNQALNCFEFENEGITYSLNPRLIIEYDNDGREQQPLPMNLSNVLIDFLKAEIIKGRDAAAEEFNAL